MSMGLHPAVYPAGERSITPAPSLPSAEGGQSKVPQPDTEGCPSGTCIAEVTSASHSHCQLLCEGSGMVPSPQPAARRAARGAEGDGRGTRPVYQSQSISLLMKPVLCPKIYPNASHSICT